MIPRNIKRYIFVLLNDFSLIAFASAIEPLRLANRMRNDTIFKWETIGITSGTVTCSNGTVVNCKMSLDFQTHREDTIVICGGTNIKRNSTKSLLSWLRKEYRKGLNIGGLCTATQILADAGLLEGKNVQFIGKTGIHF